MVYAPLGATHLAFEDISITRALPNMTIASPADAEEMKRLMPLTVEHPGPMYIRLAKGYDPIVSRSDLPFEIGRGIRMQTGEDALIVTTGITLKLALDAVERLKTEGDIGGYSSSAGCKAPGHGQPFGYGRPGAGGGFR